MRRRPKSTQVDGKVLINAVGELGGACLVDAPTGDAKAQVTGKAPAEIAAGLAEIVGITVGEEERMR